VEQLILEARAAFVPGNEPFARRFATEFERIQSHANDCRAVQTKLLEGSQGGPITPPGSGKCSRTRLGKRLWTRSQWEATSTRSVLRFAGGFLKREGLQRSSCLVRGASVEIRETSNYWPLHRRMGVSSSTSPRWERQVSGRSPFVGDSRPVERSRLGLHRDAAFLPSGETAKDYGTGFPRRAPGTVLTKLSRRRGGVIKGLQKPTDVVFAVSTTSAGLDGTDPSTPAPEFRLPRRNWLIDFVLRTSSVDDRGTIPYLISGALRENWTTPSCAWEGDPGSNPVSGESMPSRVAAGEGVSVQVPAGCGGRSLTISPILIVQHPKGDPLKARGSTPEPVTM